MKIMSTRDIVGFVKRQQEQVAFETAAHLPGTVYAVSGGKVTVDLDQGGRVTIDSTSSGRTAGVGQSVYVRRISGVLQLEGD